jgi:hypothetical protein
MTWRLFVVKGRLIPHEPELVPSHPLLAEELSVISAVGRSAENLPADTFQERE